MAGDICPLVSIGTIDCAYFLTFAVGLLWAVFVLFTGIGGDAEVPDGDAIDLAPGDVDSFDTGSVAVSPISPITISSFITTFGGIGILSRNLLHASGPVSLIAATMGGLFFALVMFLFYSRFLIGSQGSSEVQVNRLVGLTAEVTTPIVESGVGEIAVIASGGRSTYPARSRSGVAIPRGTLVVIDEMLGTLALVSPRDRSAAGVDPADGR